jgi:hypothetical protein
MSRPPDIIEALRRRIPEDVLRMCLGYLDGDQADWISYLRGDLAAVNRPRRFAATNGLLDLYDSVQGQLPRDGILEEVAARNGHLAILQRIHADRGYVIAIARVCEHAARNGHHAVVQWGRAAGYNWGRAAFAAARGGHADLLRWVIRESAPYHWRRTMRAAAGGGHCAVLEVLNAARLAARSGDHEFYEWDDSIADLAAASGQRAALEWLHAQGCPMSAGTMDAAHNHPDIVRWLREAANCPWGSRIAALTAGHGDAHMFEWLAEQGCPLGNDTITEAARSGCDEILQYAYDTLPTPWIHGYLVGSTAAGYGHLNTLKLAIRLGAPVGQPTMYLAATAGRRDIIQYLSAVGCHLDASVHTAAAMSGHTELADWLAANGCPVPGAMRPALLGAHII